MNQLESALLTELTGGAEPKLLLRTRTRIDCGRWWRTTPVWLCITKTEIILFSVARRRYTERVPLTDCSTSYYAPSSGTLVINPTESLRIKHLSLTPREALNALEFLKTSNNQPKP
jgi:hypothetical protein